MSDQTDSAPDDKVVDTKARDVTPKAGSVAARLARLESLLEAQTEAVIAVGILLSEWLPRITAIMALESKKAQNAAPDIGESAKVLLANDEEDIVEVFASEIEEDEEVPSPQDFATEDEDDYDPYEVEDEDED